MPRITQTLPLPPDGATDAEATERAEAGVDAALRLQLRAALDDAQAGELDAPAYFGVDVAETNDAGPRRRERRRAQRGPALPTVNTELGASPRRRTQAGRAAPQGAPELVNGELLAQDADAGAYYAATTDHDVTDAQGPDAGRGRLRRRNAATYPVRLPAADAMGGPLPYPREPHPQLLPLLQALRAAPVSLLAPPSALLTHGVVDGALTHAPLAQLRRLQLALATHHPDSPLADDVRRALVAKVRQALSAGLREVAQLYAASKAYAAGGEHAPFVASWGGRAGDLTRRANAHLGDERRGLPMLPGEGAVWHHCLETLRPYMLEVALTERSGERLAPRVRQDLLLSLATMQAILRSWLQDVGDDFDAVPPESDVPPLTFA